MKWKLESGLYSDGFLLILVLVFDRLKIWVGEDLAINSHFLYGCPYFIQLSGTMFS